MTRTPYLGSVRAAKVSRTRLAHTRASPAAAG